MYPQVFADFQSFLEKYDRLTGLPTPSFFYGLRLGEEISIEIGPGKILFVKLISIGDVDDVGERNIFFELNGMPRETMVTDHKLAPKDLKTRAKGDQNDPSHAVAPMPGMVTEINVEVGTKVEEGDPIVTLEAMKMLTTISAGQSGTVTEIHAAKGEAVESGDLLAKIEA